jgi:diacylglycerol kinase (ATP)
VKVLFIAHGAKRRVTKILECLESLYLPTMGEWQTSYTSCKGDASRIVREIGPGHNLVVGIGGDGIINEIVNGLMRLKDRPALAIIPAGSGNDFARSSGFHISLEKFVGALQEPSFRAIDVGIISYESSEEYFINIADTGLGPEAVKRVERFPRWVPASLKFNLAILRTFISYKKPAIACEGENFKWRDRCMLVAMANGRSFASGLIIAPDAQLDDGLFDIILVGEVSILTYIKFLPKIKKGEKINHPKVCYQQSSWVELSGLSSIEKDGESGRRLPARVEVVKEGVRVLVG